MVQGGWVSIIIFKTGACTLQENTTIDGKIITADELVVKAKQLCSMQIDTNWYWNQQLKHHVTTFPTLTILHPQLEVNAIAYLQDIPKSVCNRTQAKKPYEGILYVCMILTKITS